MSCSHGSALCSPAGGSLYLSVVVWADPSGCVNARFVHVNSWYQSLIPGRSPLLKIVLSQTPQQRVSLLSSEAGLSFIPLCRGNPTHLGGFFQVYISSYNSANRSFTYC